MGRIRLEHSHQELMVVVSIEVWHQIFKIQDQRCPWVSVRESRKDCIKGGVHDRAGLGRVFKSRQKTTERCNGIVGVPTMLFAMSTQNHCDPERAVEGMATKIATENRR